jgi:hypothetical protein
MTQSANDQGKMHGGLHTGFKSPSFRYETLPDLPGIHWIVLREILEQHLDPASFQSVWKCMQAAQDFLAKAFQPPTIKSAYRKSGVWPFKPAVILSKCPRFRELKGYQAKRVIQSLDKFADVIEKHGIIPEEEFPKILGKAIDDTPPKTGMPLNKMGPQRQRFALIDHDAFQQGYVDQAEEKEVAKQTKAGKKRAQEEAQSEDAPAKKKKTITCSNPSCGAVMGPTDAFAGAASLAGSKSSSAAAGDNWTKCDRVQCTMKFCPRKQCQKQGLAHAKVCVKAVRKPKKVKFTTGTKEAGKVKKEV